MVYLLTFSIKTLTIHGSVNIPYYNTLSVWVCLQSIFLERFSENMGSNEKELPEKDSLTYGILPQRSTEKALSEGVRVFFLGRGGFYINPFFRFNQKKLEKHPWVFGALTSLSLHFLPHTWRMGSQDLDTWLGSPPIYKPYKGHLEGVPQPDP